MNKYLVSVAIFVAGGLTSYFIMPNKVETVVETKIVEKQVDRQVAVKTRKVTSPDGTIVEEKDIRSETQTKEASQEDKYRKTVTNPKKLLIYVGKDVLRPENRQFIAGFSYQLFGPLDVGAQYNSKGHGIYATIGIRF